MSYFAQLRTIVGEAKIKKIVKKLGGKNIRIRGRLGNIKVAFVKGREKFDKMTPKAVGKKLGCSWGYVKKLRSTLKVKT